MDTAQLKAFIKIADIGSISRAADSLDVTQPSLSQQLLRLEEEIGFRLFNRNARGVTLTEAGTVFHERARQILQAANQAIADASQLRDEVKGQVVFAMPPSMAELLGASLVEVLTEQAPLIQLRLVEAFSAATRGWLESEKIDLGMLYDLGPLRHLTCRQLASDELYLIGASGRFGTFDKPVSLPLSALLNEKLAAPGPQHGLHQLLVREATKAGVDIRIRYEIDSLGTIRDLVERGLCVALLPHCAVAELARTGRLSIARIGNGEMRRVLSLVRNPSHVLTHASIRVETTLLKIMKQKISEGVWQGRLEIE